MTNKPRRKMGPKAGGPFYPNKSSAPPKTIQLTELGDVLFDACQARNNGRSRGDIVERLLRLYGPTLSFDDEIVDVEIVPEAGVEQVFAEA
jgi:hypothetical protein